MKTSYFDNPNIDVDDCVSISSRNPTEFKGGWYKPLSPDPSFLVPYLRGRTTKEEYTTEYLKLLSKLDAKEVYHQLSVLFGEDCILLCYELPGEFCHRRLVAAWFKQELGIEIEELC